MSDRLIAERMGWIACSGDHWGDKIHWKRTLGCAPFDLADARDREVVLDHLTNKGFRVLIACTEFECTVKIMRSNGVGQWVYFPEATAHLDADGPDYKAVAFRAAVLAATEGKEQ